jgi:hypothetical protein
MMKKLLIAGGVLVVILVAAVVFLAHNLDSIVEKAIQDIGSDMAGVSVKVSKVSISLKDGRGEIKGLAVGSPKGYKASHTVRLGSIVLALDPATVTKDVIVVRELIIEAPDLTYEKGPGGTNLEVIQRNVDAYVKKNFGGGAPKDKSKKEDAAKETKFIIEKLQIRNGKVNMPGAIAGRDIKAALPPVNLTNIGKSRGGATGAEVASIVVKQMTDAAIASATKAIAQEAKGRAGEALKGRILGR